MSSLLQILTAFALMLTLAACADHTKFKAARPAAKSAPALSPSPTPNAGGKIVDDDGSDDDDVSREPLLWEKSKAESVMWSAYAMRIIGDEAAAKLLPGAADVETFCPKYRSLEREQKVNFWAYLVSAVARYESSFKPTTRMREKGLGIDRVTGQPVHSEGLLQLSYQDGLHYKFCKFDWEADRKLDVNDPRRTILDPLVNLKCGINILAHQVKMHNRISILGGAYWSVLRPPGGTNSKVTKIRALTQKLSFCS